MKSFLIAALLAAVPASVWAQTPTDPVEAGVPEALPVPGWTSKVTVRAGLDKAPVPNAVVFLRAARPKGPFEPTDPAPVHEWTAISDEAGVARFVGLPESLSSSGLRLHAATTWNGMTFKSAAVPPADKLGLDVDVFEKGVDLDGVRFSSVRTVIEPWEDYLIFTQFYTLTNTAKTALDVSLLPGEDFERGLPIRLPTKAQGVRVNGGGQTTIINEFVYWQGTLKPNEQVPLQISFSMPIHTEEYVYEQTLGYDADNVEVLVPLQTRFAKLPRLDHVTLAAPDFRVERGNGLFGMREDMEFIGATGKRVKKGESFKFKLDGLPFHRPMAPFVVFGIALLCALTIAFLGRREVAHMKSSVGRSHLQEALLAEREELLEALVALRGDLAAGRVTQEEFEALSITFSERLALVMQKLAVSQATA